VFDGEAASTWAVETMIGHWDGYSYYIMNNYRVYATPRPICGRSSTPASIRRSTTIWRRSNHSMRASPAAASTISRARTPTSKS
jgi:hypothetical protein